jgi:hypothetical protein
MILQSTEQGSAKNEDLGKDSDILHFGHPYYQLPNSNTYDWPTDQAFTITLGDFRRLMLFERLPRFFRMWSRFFYNKDLVNRVMGIDTFEELENVIKASDTTDTDGILPPSDLTVEDKELDTDYIVEKNTFQKFESDDLALYAMRKKKGFVGENYEAGGQFKGCSANFDVQSDNDDLSYDSAEAAANLFEQKYADKDAEESEYDISDDDVGEFEDGDEDSEDDEDVTKDFKLRNKQILEKMKVKCKSRYYSDLYIFVII